MSKFSKFIFIVLLFIWQLPQNIVALLMMPFLGKLKIVEKRNFTLVLSGEYMSGGISLGNFIFLSENMAKNKPSIEHELGHAVDSKKMGPLYLFIIGIPSIIHAWLYDSKCSCYYDFFTEKRANRNAKIIKVVKPSIGRCYLDLI